jgi:ERCC4-type nuclease
MSPIEKETMLASMVVLVDTREQPTAQARRRYNSFGLPYRRATLDFGDYTYNAIKPDGTWIHDESSRIIPLVSVERKMSLDELASCFTHGRKRFAAEFDRAKEAGARIVLLVEGATWENLINGRYRSRFRPKAFLASIVAWMIRYGAGILFCKEDTSGQLIKEVLYRDLKERIENGEYG